MDELSRDRFRSNGDSWTTTVRLPAWAGFQSRRGPYGSRDADELSDGVVELHCETRDGAPLADADLARVRWVVEHQVEVRDALLAALLAAYPEVRSMVGLHAVHVHALEKAGLPYVGFELGCEWDEEHGLGVLMHGTRCVDLGGADTAFLGWNAERDAGG